MEPEQCPKLDDCPKIKMILDKDLLDFQYAEAIRAVCAKCNEGKATRDEIVKQLRETGLTYAEIGRRLGISRERVRQIDKGKPNRRKPALDSKVMLTTTDVAQLLGLHPNTVRRWNAKGILKSYRIGPRGDRRFKREDIEAFIGNGKTE